MNSRASDSMRSFRCCSRLFAALLLITLTGVALFAITVWIARRALARWHESELAPTD